MGQYGPNTFTPSLGKFGFFGIDTYQTPTPASQPLYPLPFHQQNPLGIKVYDDTPTLALPWGLQTAYRYVRYVDSANTAVTATGPFPVYWTDNSFTAVTPLTTQAFYSGLNAVAGYAMPNLTALPQFATAAALATAMVGNLIWIAVAGYLPGAVATAATAGGTQTGSATAFASTNTASGTGITTRALGYAMAAAVSGLANVIVTIESL